jgi:hypothetical protein
VRQQEREIGQSDVVGRRIREALELAHAVVADVADGAAVEAREVPELGGAAGREEAAHVGQRRLAVARPRRRGALDPHAPVPGLDGGEGVAADEGVTGPALSALDALQQEGVARSGAEPAERAHGRVVIGEHRARHGDDRVAAREGVELCALGTVTGHASLKER